MFRLINLELKRYLSQLYLVFRNSCSLFFNNSCILNRLLSLGFISWILNIERGSNIKVDKVDAELVSNVKNRLVLLLAVICRHNPDVARQLVGQR